MAAMTFVDYYEYTRDAAFLASTAYPFVTGAADFYVSYATLNNATGYYDILNACSQVVPVS
jgi:trehalose/maltose hydrolase-like predicted phosphorylase